MENENKLPEEFKDKWCAALRSGEYKQCTGQLHDAEGGHCCLGVGEIVLGVKSESGYLLRGKSIPKVIRGNSVMAEELIRMNDDSCKTFSEIADFIEQNL